MKTLPCVSRIPHFPTPSLGLQPLALLPWHGGRVTCIASDWREVRVRLPLNWRTRNYVGTLFGGSLYGAVDPFYMLMLMKNRGPEHLVWDKAATIRFRKPGRTTLTATFRLEDDELESLRSLLAVAPKVDRTYVIQLVDVEGTVHAEVEKVPEIRRRRPEKPVI